MKHSLCSAHQIPDENCSVCKMTPEDLFGEESWQKARKEAEEAGKHVCEYCGFEYYLTINFCPLCNKKHMGP